MNRRARARAKPQKSDLIVCTFLLASPVSHRKVTDLLNACITLSFNICCETLGQVGWALPDWKVWWSHSCHLVGQPGLRAWWWGVTCQHVEVFSRENKPFSPPTSILVISALIQDLFNWDYGKEQFLPGTDIFRHWASFKPTFTAAVHHLASFSFKILLIPRCQKSVWKRIRRKSTVALPLSSPGRYYSCTFRCFLLELLFLQHTSMNLIIFNSCFISNLAHSLYFSMCLSQSFAHSTLQGMYLDM